MNYTVRMVCLAALAVMVAAQPVAAQHDESADRDSTATTTDSAKTTMDGVYTMAQAERGQRLSQQECLICHAPSEWSTPTFLRLWQDRPILGLYDMIRLTMPYDLPGRFTREEYADIMAYILRLNDLPEGENPLPAEEEALNQIIIATEDPET